MLTAILQNHFGLQSLHNPFTRYPKPTTLSGTSKNGLGKRSWRTLLQKLGGFSAGIEKFSASRNTRTRRFWAGSLSNMRMEKTTVRNEEYFEAMWKSFGKRALFVATSLQNRKPRWRTRTKTPSSSWIPSSGVLQLRPRRKAPCSKIKIPSRSRTDCAQLRVSELACATRAAREQTRALFLHWLSRRSHVSNAQVCDVKCVFCPLNPLFFGAVGFSLDINVTDDDEPAFDDFSSGGFRTGDDHWRGAGMTLGGTVYGLGTVSVPAATSFHSLHFISPSGLPSHPRLSTVSFLSWIYLVFLSTLHRGGPRWERTTNLFPAQSRGRASEFTVREDAFRSYAVVWR